MDHLDDRTFDLLFAVRRSVRYHDHRRRFFEIWNSVTVTAAVAGGSSAVAVFLSHATSGWIAALISGGVALIGAVDLAVGTARRADRHGDLARQFIGLEQRFALDRSLDDAEYEPLVRERLRIEASEPTVLRLLDVMCHYEVLLSLGDEREPPRIPLWRRFLAHWVSQAGYVVLSMRQHRSETPAG